MQPGSGTPDAAKGASEAIEEPAVAVRRVITEDWVATILGLVLLALVLIGIITKGMVP